MHPIIDTDSHVAEPPDLWTSRMSAKWGDQIPHVIMDPRRNEPRWLVGGRKLTGVANWVAAGWPEYPPSYPKSVEEADPGGFDPHARLKWMDKYGITAQVLFPNLLTFSVHAFLALADEHLMLECVQAYNDFQADFASAAPDRFITLTALPFWDIVASAREIVRCHELGHRGVLLMSKPYKLGLPPLHDPHWEPVLRTAEELGVSINFHVGYQDMSEDDLRAIISAGNSRAQYAKESSLAIMGLAEAVAELLTSGTCIKYPSLKFVLVESGFGWVPYLLETLDWQWVNSGAKAAFPDREMPSVYFRRQVYMSFWYEQATVRSMGDQFADNLMFETDYPHATSLSPGPASSAREPWRVAHEAVARMPDDVQRKILFENAAKLYQVKVPD